MVKIEFDTDKETVTSFEGKMEMEDCLILLEAVNGTQAQLQAHLKKLIALRDIELLREVALYYDDGNKQLKDIYADFLSKQK